MMHDKCRTMNRESREYITELQFIVHRFVSIVKSTPSTHTAVAFGEC